MSKHYVVNIEGNKTIVRDDKGNIGISRCNPEDKFDIVEGFKVALERIEKRDFKLQPKEKALLESLQTYGIVKIYKSINILYLINKFGYIIGYLSDCRFYNLKDKIKYTIQDLLEFNK